VYDGLAYPFKVDRYGNAAVKSCTGGTGSFTNLTAGVCTGGTGSFANLAVSGASSFSTVVAGGTGTFGALRTTGAIDCNSITSGPVGGTSGNFGTIITSGTGTFFQGIECGIRSATPSGAPFRVAASGNAVCATLTANSIVCASLKTSGSLAATTTFQNLYTLVGNQSGFITIRGSLNSMWMGYFDWSGVTFPSLTCLAQSGNAFQAGVNTPGTNGGGTQTMTIQLSLSGPFYIQVKTTSASTVTWNTLLF
jgi:hypothetical protein